MNVLGTSREVGRALLRMDKWLLLVTAALSLAGLLFVHSSTMSDAANQSLFGKQVVFLVGSAVAGLLLVLVPYGRILRFTWPLYGVVLASLVLLPFFGIMVNGARRWYRLPGFSLQPAEFAKLAVIIGLAAWFRFRGKGGVWWPLVIAGVPALLVMRQPDLGSSLVFWPIVFAVCYAAGTSARKLLLVGLCGLLCMGGLWFGLRDYQRQRVEVWAAHFSWNEGAENQGGEKGMAIREQLRGPAYQPWQSLIAIGSGGTTGFGLQRGPQSQYDFLPYRHADYLFSVLAEETGFVGASAFLFLEALFVLLILAVAMRTRERFGRLVCIGVAAWLGSQTVMHVAVCAWLVPATGLPLPLLSYGGSSTLAAVLGVALVLNVSARRMPVFGGDGYA